MRTWFLKCYYGYKNFGDELLLFGVLDWIHQHQIIDVLYIEVWDEIRMQHWLDRNITRHDQLWFQIKLLQIGTYDKELIRGAIKFFGGGEVINDQDAYISQHNNPIIKNITNIVGKYFARSWRNYFLKYFPDIRRGNFYLLGGIGKPYRQTTRLLYAMMLPRARHIVARDDESFAIAWQYTTRVTLASDFSLPVLHYFANQKTAPGTAKTSPDQYVLCNATPHLATKSWLPELERFCQHRKTVPKFFMPCDIENDMPLYAKLQKHIPDLKLYNWTNHTLDETLQLFRDTQAGCGARLHFLYPLKVFHKPREVIVYKDKVRKLILSP